MKKFIPAEKKDTIGTHFDGFLIMPYTHLVKQLGEPHQSTKKGVWYAQDGKTRVEWAFKTRHAKPTVITIYDFKETAPLEDVLLWHTGIKGDVRRFFDFFKEHNLSYPEGKLPTPQD